MTHEQAATELAILKVLKFEIKWRTWVWRMFNILRLKGKAEKQAVRVLSLRRELSRRVVAVMSDIASSEGRLTKPKGDTPC